MIPYSPHCIIEIGGQRFDSWRDEQWFLGVDVTLSSGVASEAAWSLYDPGNLFLDRWLTGEGVRRIESSVYLGFNENLGKPIFEGLLTSAEWYEDRTLLRFYDMGYVMRQEKRTGYHRNLDDVEIIAKLARQNKLNFEPPIPSIKLDKHKSIIQDAQTDWEHAQERAQDAGLVLYVRGNTLYAKEAAKAGKPVVSLALGEDFQILAGTSFRYVAPENVAGRNSVVEVRAGGRGGKRLTGESATNGRGTKVIEIKRDLAIKTKRHANRRAQAQKDLQREHAFSGSIALLPNFNKVRPDIRDTVEVLNVGKLFSGSYIANEVEHSFAPGRFETNIQLYRDICDCVQALKDGNPNDPCYQKCLRSKRSEGVL